MTYRIHEEKSHVWLVQHSIRSGLKDKEIGHIKNNYFKGDINTYASKQ